MDGKPSFNSALAQSGEAPVPDKPRLADRENTKQEQMETLPFGPPPEMMSAKQEAAEISD
jgi:hypothetical protein